jgi:dipeptidyl aminopeptidase/acylaminoacyl peptidase
LIGWYVLRRVQRVIGYRFDDIAPINTIARVRCPVLLAHGTEDRTVPFPDARRILAARAHGGVGLVALPGGHDTRAAMTQRIEALICFLNSALVGVGAAEPGSAALPPSQARKA